jgi:UDP-N-acetylmuramoylalanine--D-glutamate ligase
MAEACARVENGSDNSIGFKNNLNRNYRKVWVGGNIGNPLLSVADEMTDKDLAIIELSSFQLEVMTRSPQMAVILNLTPNHLDRHRTMDAYINAKARILEYQNFDDIAVLGRNDSRVWDLHKRVKGRLVTFGRERFDLNMDFSNSKSGFHPAIDVYLDGKDILLNRDNIEEYIVSCKDIGLRGTHNILNVAAACAIAAAAGIPSGAMREGIRNFRGVPHRLEFVRSWRGAEWYNDSIATAPERAIAGIQAFDDPIVLIAGGRDKNLAWDEFVHLLCQRVDHLITFGEIAQMISEKVQRIRSDRPLTVTVCRDLKTAVRNASQVASRGDVVLFSPGGTSFDEFFNFEDRGDKFKQWVMTLK